MKRFTKGILIGLLILGFSPNFVYSCTTFRIEHDNQFYFGRNFDYIVGRALLVVNKRGVKKTAYKKPVNLNFYYEEASPAVWTSKYGSVTFNLFGCGFPQDGMNEAGLVVAGMSLAGTLYPATDSRPGVNNLQWRQYQLDNHSTVDEVIASDSKIRILSKGSLKTHFLVSDKSGKCAVIEFLGRRMVVYTGETMPVMALTNSRYAESLGYWKKGVAPRFDKWKSLTRFILASNMLREYRTEPSRPPVNYAFDILSQVSLSILTKWSVVYDQNNLRVHFITYNNKKIRTVDLNKFDFSCRTPVRVLDANADLAGDVTAKFQDYTQKINRNLIGASYGGSRLLRYVPPELLDKLSRYPDSMTCDKKREKRSDLWRSIVVESPCSAD
jgi:choloylglycine hydrolase